MRVFAALLLAAVAVGSAQTYKCDWSVVAIAGGDMAGGAYRCGATAGQTAAGYMNSPLLQAFIGYWQTDIMTGIAEEQVLPGGERLVTKLLSPYPNPLRARAVIRYSLAADAPVRLVVHDLAGRVVRTLVSGGQRPGRYSANWNGADDRGRLLSPGVYFCRLQAGDYARAEKLVIAR